MALYLRGNVWWMEYRTRTVRRRVSTGLAKNQKAKAKEVYAAFRLAMSTGQKKDVVESILRAIYDGSKKKDDSFDLASMWGVYEDWIATKGRVLARRTLPDRMHCLDRFVRWAAERNVTAVHQVGLPIAKQYALFYASKHANKTTRIQMQTLSHIWDAVAQMAPGSVRNPWKAVTPDLDGSSRRREHFSSNEAGNVLGVALAMGHDWYGTSLVSLYTGLRYGDVAQLEWDEVCLEDAVIRLMPNKTKRRNVRVTMPLARPLLEFLSSRERSETGWVFPEHALVYPHQLEVKFSDVLKAAGMDTEAYTFHSWRHTFRTRLAEAGVSDDVARRLGGWTNLEMAAHYDHGQRLEELRSAIGKIG